MASGSDLTSLEARISKSDNTSITSASVENSETKASTSNGLESSADPNAAAGPKDEEADSNLTTDSNLNKAQTDGAGGQGGGTTGIYEPDYDVDVELSEVQKDPNNPLYSIKTFDELGLAENILKGIYQMRFTKPSKIQEKALPLLLGNPAMNLIGQSQSGTGKTAAFVLNILSRLDLSTPEMCETPQALCLAPTRELARQILGVFQIMGQFIDGLKVSPAIPMDAANRGQPVAGQIVVGTPGTAMDLIRKRLIKSDQIKVLVLDEADNMLDLQGLGEQCMRVKQMLPPTVQLVLFSATFPQNVMRYAAKFASNANKITLRHEDLTVEGIKQLYLDCSSEKNKYESLVKLYGLMTIGSSIIFVRTRDDALKIEQRMNEEHHKVACLTGQFEGYQRDIIIDSFRDGRTKVLITTNVLARGIDVQTVSLVVNYDVPEDGRGNADPQTYLHRIGRTGRFGRIGVSITLIYGHEAFKSMRTIADYFKIELKGLDTSDWDEIEAEVKRTIKGSRVGNNYDQKKIGGPEIM